MARDREEIPSEEHVRQKSAYAALISDISERDRSKDAEQFDDDTGDAATHLQVAGHLIPALHHNALISTRRGPRPLGNSAGAPLPIGAGTTMMAQTTPKSPGCEHMLSHTSIPKNVAVLSGLSTPCSWNSSASTFPCYQPFAGDTPSPSAGRERERRAVLSTACRRKTSSDHAVNDDI